MDTGRRGREGEGGGNVCGGCHPCLSPTYSLSLQRPNCRGRCKGDKVAFIFQPLPHSLHLGPFLVIP